MDFKRILAFDFGASSGRAIIGNFENGIISLEEIHRFDNDPVLVGGTFYWDILRLFHEIKQGITKAKNTTDFDSIGIDTWGVDYGLLDKNDKLLSKANFSAFSPKVQILPDLFTIRKRSY